MFLKRCNFCVMPITRLRIILQDGICEDIFQSIMHMISQNIRQKFSIKNL